MNVNRKHGLLQLGSCINTSKEFQPYVKEVHTKENWMDITSNLISFIEKFEDSKVNSSGVIHLIPKFEYKTPTLTEIRNLSL